MEVEGTIFPGSVFLVHYRTIYSSFLVRFTRPLQIDVFLASSSSFSHLLQQRQRDGKERSFRQTEASNFSFPYILHLFPLLFPPRFSFLSDSPLTLPLSYSTSPFYVLTFLHSYTFLFFLHVFLLLPVFLLFMVTFLFVPFLLSPASPPPLRLFFFLNFLWVSCTSCC